MPDPKKPSPRAREAQLRAEIARLNKINQALMDRAESGAQVDGSGYNLFHANMTLEDLVRRRTEELQKALQDKENGTLALRGSEDRNRLLIENSPFCIHEADLQGKVTSMNRAGLAMLGLTDESQVRGRPCLDAVDAVDRERIGALLADAYAGKSSHFEFHASGPGAKIFKSCFVPIKNEHGEVVKLMGITEDVSESKRVEQALHGLHKDFVDFLENTRDFVFFKDQNSRIRFCSQTLADITGHRSWRDMIGKHDLEIFPTEIADIYCEEERPVLTEGKTLTNKTDPYYDEQGDLRWMSTNKWPLFGDDKKTVVGLLGISRDITESKKVEEELHKIQRLLNETEQIGKVGGWEFYPSTGKQTWSPELHNILEVGPGFEPTKEKTLELYAPASKPQIEFAMKRAVEQGIPFDLELQVVTAKGKLRTVHVIGKADTALGRVHGFVQDITERKQTEDTLRENEKALAMREREFRTLAENSPDNVARYDRAARILYVNPTMERTLNRPAQSLIGRTPQEIIPGGLFSALQQAILQVGATGESISIEQTIPAGNERPHIHSIYIVAEKSLDGVPLDVLAVGRDISSMKRAEENLRITASVFDSSQEGIAITDAAGKFLDVNPAFTRITGYTREEVLGKNAHMLSSGRHDKAFYLEMWHALKQQGAWRGEIWNRRKSGELYTELLSIAAICDDHGAVQRYVGVFSDISYLKTHEAELSQFANFDVLTGIPNRRLLVDRLSQAIARAKRYGKTLSVCLIDLDGFKQINDIYGHEAGDRLLIEVAHRLQSVLRAEDTLARLGGDEFVVLFNDLAGNTECVQILDRILDMISMPIDIDGHAVTISASIGATFYSANDETGETLLRQADRAMYVAKHGGKARYHFYEPLQDEH